MNTRSLCKEMSNATKRATSCNEQQTDLDAILDEALDELDDSDNSDSEIITRDNVPICSDESSTAEVESSTRSRTAPACKSAPLLEKSDASSTRSDEKQKATANDSLDVMMKQLMSGSLDPQDAEAAAMLNSFMQQLQSEFQAEIGSEATTRQPINSDQESKPPKSRTPVAGPPPPPPPPREQGVDKAIDALLENLNEPATSENEMDEATKMMEELTREFEKFMPSAEGDDPSDALMDGMMQQLLSKELMYEPMKQVCDKFPVWLESKKDTLSTEEYDRRCKQLECFKQLVNVYETQSDNTELLITLMERVQEYGQPPEEIVQELAPGLVFDDMGMPQGAAGEQDCVIM